MPTLKPAKNETEKVRLKKAHIHRRVVCGPETDNKSIYVRPDQARRMKAAGIAEPETTAGKGGASAEG